MVLSSTLLCVLSAMLLPGSLTHTTEYLICVDLKLSHPHHWMSYLCWSSQDVSSTPFNVLPVLLFSRSVIHTAECLTCVDLLRLCHPHHWMSYLCFCSADKLENYSHWSHTVAVWWNPESVQPRLFHKNFSVSDYGLTVNSSVYV
jgi:hypothetical protein